MKIKPGETLMCHRCEHRAKALETGHGPRCECTDFGKSVCACYMYRPVYPVVLKRREGDRRPVGVGAMIAPRLECAGAYDKLEPVFRKLGRGKWTIVLQNKQEEPKQ